MYKVVFELLTDPLNLPVPWFYEYIGLIVVDKIAFHYAWEISPGGRLGREIHWSVRTIAFFVVWAILYGIIVVVQWVIANWVKLLYICACVLFVALTTGIIITNIKQLKDEEKEETPNERNEKQRN